MIQTIGIVSLSRGILGEDFLHHELDLGLGTIERIRCSRQISPPCA